MFSDLESLANKNGESIRRGKNSGYYADMLHRMQDYSEAMAMHFGFIDSDMQDSQLPSDVSLNGLMNP